MDAYERFGWSSAEQVTVTDCPRPRKGESEKDYVSRFLNEMQSSRVPGTFLRSSAIEIYRKQQVL
jgi:hypothetical protein